MNLRHFIPLILVISTNLTFSQILTPKQELTIKSDLKNFFNGNDTIVNSIILNNGGRNLTTTPNDTFYNVDGYHFVYRLKNGSATRLDRSFFHGGNFNRFLFSHKGKVFLLGGYGMFTTNNNLEVFSEDLKEYNFIPTTGDVPKFILGLVLKSNDKIYVLKSIKAGNNAVDDVFDDNIYELDLNSFKWRKFPNISTDFVNVYLKNYTLMDYTVSIFMSSIAIIKNSTLEYIILNKEQYELKAEFDLVYADRNSLKLKTLDSTPLKKTTHVVFDIDKLWNLNKSKIRKIEVNPTIFQRYPIITNSILVLLLISAISLSILLYRNVSLRHKLKSIVKLSPKSTIENPIVEALKRHSNSVLTSDELDEIFGIIHMENESKKTKRHRLITQINTNIPNFITRDKDELDKRKFVYRINNEINESDVTNM